VLADLVADDTTDDAAGDRTANITGDRGAGRGANARANDGIAVAVRHASAPRQRQDAQYDGHVPHLRFHRISPVRSNTANVHRRRWSNNR
jgi:hypothetical protein